MSSFVRWIRRSRSSSQPQRSRALVTASAAVALLITAGALVIGPHSLASAQSSTFDDYASSPGLAEDHADVFRLYWAFFDRKPEVDGAQYWVGRYNQCASLNDITWSFGNSTEFVKTYGALSDRDYITLVYSNVLDRTPDENGYQYWLGLLSNGTLTRSELMLYFSLGDEFRRQRPLPSDGVAYGGCTPPPTATTTTTSTSTSVSTTTSTSTSSDPQVFYANCTEAREAGAAPLRRGDPGYRAGLDRDGDGIACELS